jgi:hypothetical protein
MTDRIVSLATLVLGIALLVAAVGPTAWETLRILGDLVGAFVLSEPLASLR